MIYKSLEKKQAVFLTAAIQTDARGKIGIHTRRKSFEASHEFTNRIFCGRYHMP